VATLTRPGGGTKKARPASRTIDDLLADFGTTMPRKAPPPASPPAEKLFPHSVKAGGVRRMGHGWAATMPPLAGYQMTSEEIPVLWPLISGDGLPPWGAEMGYDVLSGGKFYCDPMGWVLDDSDSGDQPEHLHLRQAGARQERHREGVHAAHDPLRLPVAGPG
jgi:hypothetical protein